MSRILIIEKQSIFNALIQRGNIDGYLLMSSKGYPDYKTQYLLGELKRYCEQIYYLGDLDPYGFDIYL